MPKEKRTLIVEELTWKDARNMVLNSSKELAAIIDDLSPGKELPLFKVKYIFGSKIAENSVLHLPAELSYQQANAEVFKGRLACSPLPLGVIVKNSIELFFDINHKIFSLAIYGKGLKIGVCEYLGWLNQHTITAGARSLYMLPKISETLAHRQLKKRYNVVEAPPRHLYDHWKIFKQIAKSQEFKTEWFCEVIFFSNSWIERLKKDPAWSRFNMYINRQGWQQSLYARKKVSLDVAWESFVRFLSNKELRFDSHVVDILKHIIYIATQTVPASAPHQGDSELGPLKEVQLAYEDPKGYGLGKYLATIMQPQYFSLAKPAPVYYSLQLTNIFESLPRGKKITSVIDNVRELCELIELFLHGKNNEAVPWLGIITENSTLGNLLERLQVEYFHGDMFAYGNLIKPSTKLPDFDSRLIYNPSQDKKRIFAGNSTFLRGCVMISATPTPK